MKFTWLSGLKLSRKFMILGAITLVLVTVPFVAFFATSQQGVEFAERELSGFEPATRMLKVITLAQEHRGMSASALAGNETFIAALPAKRKENETAIMELDAVIQQMDAPELRELWGKTRQTWTKIADAVAGRNVSGTESFNEHSRLIENYFVQMDLILDHFGLSLDSKPDSYHLIQAAYGSIARLNEALGSLRGLGGSFLSRAALLRNESVASDDEASEASVGTTQAVDGGMSIAERTRLATMLADAHANLDVTVRRLNKTIAAAPALRASLQAPLAEAKASADEALALARREIIDAERLTMDAQDYFGKVTDAMAVQLRLSDLAVSTLGDTLRGTVSELRFNQIALTLFIVALMATGFLVSMFVMRTITGPVTYLQEVMEKLRGGDSTVRANLTTSDEVGLLAQQFDRMVDEREAIAARIQRENEQLNESVLVLLQGVAKLAQRDLTAKVPVAEDVTGAVSDALNLLSRETAKVLKQVTDISADVSGASLKVKEQSDTVLATAEVERQQVERTAEELRVASQAMERIEQLAQSANRAADNAIKTAQSALSTVNATVGGINSTRDTIRETEKRIKRLGERSQEISGVVGLINTIAERTHILALNASMHAASAGEAGRGFAVVAEEVQRLAENARQATGQIATLVNNIQVETVDTVNTMNAAITQVVDGSRLAEQAGQQMQLTQQTTAELVESVRQIAFSSQEQAKISAELLNRAGDIRKSTEQTSLKLNEQAEQTSNLVEYARALLGAVRVFKLPA